MLKARFAAREVCSVCNPRFTHNPGDLWLYWVLGDRLFLGLLILFVFVVIRPVTWEAGLALLGVSILPMILTIPHRTGIAIGLEYFARSRFDT